jgi:putative sigma-54 modulation protein
LIAGKTKVAKSGAKLEVCSAIRQKQQLPPTLTTKATMKDLPIHITPHDVHLSPALRGFIQKKISALSRFAGDMLAAEVVLRGKSGAKHLFSVSARLALPGQDVQGNATHANLYSAIDGLVSRLARLSRKRKTRLAKPYGVRATLAFFAGI